MKSIQQLIIIFVIISAFGTACGGSKPQEPSRQTVVLKEFAIEPQDIVLSAGQVIFAIKNEGSVEHDFAIEGVEEQADPIFPGDATEFRLTLEPGTYNLICTISGHKEAGMIGTLVVEE